MSDKKEAIKQALSTALGFEAYLALIVRLHTEEKATSFQDERTYYDYSVLSLRRMQRIHKRAALSEEALASIQGIKNPQTWMIITESWCGDASQTVPLIVRLAEENDNIDVRIVLRDSHPEVMEHYLTNGGKSIPILAMLDAELNEVGRWGPRPAEAQQKVLDYKALPEPRPPYAELNIELQKWYNADKGMSTLSELIGSLADTVPE